jgi:hypothetical protein
MTDNGVVKAALAHARAHDGLVRIALHGHDYESDCARLMTPAQAMSLAEMLIRSSREILDRKVAP